MSEHKMLQEPSKMGAKGKHSSRGQATFPAVGSAKVLRDDRASVMRWCVRRSLATRVHVAAHVRGVM